MNKAIKDRIVVVIVFSFLLSIFAVSTVYLFRVDKDNNNLSMFMFLTLILSGLTIGNLFALIALIRKKGTLGKTNG